MFYYPYASDDGLWSKMQLVEQGGKIRAHTYAPNGIQGEVETGNAPCEANIARRDATYASICCFLRAAHSDSEFIAKLLLPPPPLVDRCHVITIPYRSFCTREFIHVPV